MSCDLEGVLAQLRHDQQLVRSKGQNRLRTLFDNGQIAESERIALKSGVRSMLSSDVAHERMGGFLTAALMLPHFADEAEFLQVLEESCMRHLEHSESRVRSAVGDCLSALAAVQGSRLYASIGEALRKSIVRNFERDEEAPVTTDEDPLESLLQTSYHVTKPGSGEMRHGTEGWKSLETSYRALLKVVEATGTAFGPFATTELWNLVFRGVQHSNRFVREVSYLTISALVKNSGNEEGDIVGVLAKGLGDDWSQVRYAASVASRTFVMQRKDGAHDAFVALLPKILPQMCLNRYYVAEGVRLYSQETWKMAVGDQGRQWVAQFTEEFVDYYTRQCGANNHAVREAACSCIAELMTKVDRTAVAPYVRRLIQALVNCFKDASWPVRDAACCACGQCVMAFPEPSRALLEELYSLWLAHLADNIASVREDSAVALGNAIRAYGDEGKQKILPEIHTMILRAKEQKADSTQFSGLNNVTQFGVAGVKEADDNDAAHTDQTMFSCGSLAPKLARGGGCMDHGFKRPKEMWEESDGAVYFVRELSAIDAQASLEFLPALTELLGLHHFAHANKLHETVWKVLPVIARHLGKRLFKKYINDWLDPLFRSLQCGHQLEEAAALKAMISFSQFLGEGIFRGRLNERQSHLFDTFKGDPMYRTY